MGDVYDNLGLTAAASLTWCAVVVIPFIVGLAFVRSGGAMGAWYALDFLWTVFVTAPVTAGAFHLAASIAKRDSPTVADIFSGIRAFYSQACKLALAEILITIVALTDVWFLFALFFANKNPVFALLGAVAIYAFLFWGMMVMYQWPLLVEQKPPTWKLIYRSFLFAADNLGFTAGVFFVIILLTILCAGPGMALLYMGAAAITSTTALRELMRKYGLVEIEKETVEDSGWHIGDYR